jgi:hypothetical protein
MAFPTGLQAFVDSLSERPLEQRSRLEKTRVRPWLTFTATKVPLDLDPLGRLHAGVEGAVTVTNTGNGAAFQVRVVLHAFHGYSEPQDRHPLPFTVLPVVRNPVFTLHPGQSRRVPYDFRAPRVGIAAERIRILVAVFDPIDDPCSHDLGLIDASGARRLADLGPATVSRHVLVF